MQSADTFIHNDMCDDNVDTAGEPSVQVVVKSSEEVLTVKRSNVTDPNQKPSSDILQFSHSSREMQMDSATLKVEHDGLNLENRVEQLNIEPEDYREFEVKNKKKPGVCKRLKRWLVKFFKKSEQPEQANSILKDKHDEMQKEKKEGAGKRFKRWLRKCYDWLCEDCNMTMVWMTVMTGGIFLICIIFNIIAFV